MKISQKQFNQVHFGMTKDEVRHLVAEPARTGKSEISESAESPEAFQDCWFWGSSGERNYTVCFVNGEVAAYGFEVPH